MDHCFCFISKTNFHRQLMPQLVKKTPTNMPRQATHFVSFCQVLEWLVGFFSLLSLSLSLSVTLSLSLSLFLTPSLSLSHSHSLSLFFNVNPLLSLTEEGWPSSFIEWSPPLSYWRLCHCVKIKISVISSRFHQSVTLGCFTPSFAKVCFVGQLA